MSPAARSERWRGGTSAAAGRPVGPHAGLIDAKPLPRGEELRLFYDSYRGHDYLHCRKFYRGPDGDWRPGRGLTIRAADVVWLRKALQQAEERGAELGILAEEDFELAGEPIPEALLR